MFVDLRMWDISWIVLTVVVVRPLWLVIYLIYHYNEIIRENGSEERKEERFLGIAVLAEALFVLMWRQSDC